jgi:hypothetical protein
LFTPQRYISLNTNIAWKLEGTVYETIDMKNIISIAIKDNQVEINYLCEQCSEVHTITCYLTKNDLINKLCIFRMKKLFNTWATYKEKKDRFTTRHSKKETQSSMIYLNSDDLNDYHDSDEDEED